MNEKTDNIVRHVRGLIEEHKREIEMYYVGYKLKIPTHIKSSTISELREAGAIVDPDIFIPKEADSKLRLIVEYSTKRDALEDKLEKVKKQMKSQIETYYETMKHQLPKELLKKKMGELTEEEWLLLGIDMTEVNGV